jgi:hypothetical protein
MARTSHAPQHKYERSRKKPARARGVRSRNTLACMRACVRARERTHARRHICKQAPHARARTQHGRMCARRRHAPCRLAERLDGAAAGDREVLEAAAP